MHPSNVISAGDIDNITSITVPMIKVLLGAVNKEIVLCIDSGPMWGKCVWNFVRWWIEEVGISVWIARWIANFTDEIGWGGEVIWIYGVGCGAGD